MAMSYQKCIGILFLVLFSFLQTNENKFYNCKVRGRIYTHSVPRSKVDYLTYIQGWPLQSQKNEVLILPTLNTKAAMDI
jgi:hypothetical protein